MDPQTMERLTIIQARYAEVLLNLPHVIGVAIGLAKVDGCYTDEPAIVVMVDEKVDEDDLCEGECIPYELEGVRVDVQAFGGFSAQPAASAAAADSECTDDDDDD